MSYVSDDYLVDCDASRGKMSARGAQINTSFFAFRDGGSGSGS